MPPPKSMYVRPSGSVTRAPSASATTRRGVDIPGATYRARSARIRSAAEVSVGCIAGLSAFERCCGNWEARAGGEAGGGTRTHGRLITNQVLYQLSYSGTRVIGYGSRTLGNSRARLVRCDDRDDLELDEVGPALDPEIECATTLRVHHLEARAQVVRDPARDVVDTLGRQTAAFAKATVDRAWIAAAIALGDVEEHPARRALRASSGARGSCA